MAKVTNELGKNTTKKREISYTSCTVDTLLILPVHNNHTVWDAVIQIAELFLVTVFPFLYFLSFLFYNWKCVSLNPHHLLH